MVVLAYKKRVFLLQGDPRPGSRQFDITTTRRVYRPDSICSTVKNILRSRSLIMAAEMSISTCPRSSDDLPIDLMRLANAGIKFTRCMLAYCSESTNAEDSECEMVYVDSIRDG